MAVLFYNLTKGFVSRQTFLIKVKCVGFYAPTITSDSFEEHISLGFLTTFRYYDTNDFVLTKSKKNITSGVHALFGWRLIINKRNKKEKMFELFFSF